MIRLRFIGNFFECLLISPPSSLNKWNLHVSELEKIFNSSNKRLITIANIIIILPDIRDNNNFVNHTSGKWALLLRTIKPSRRSTRRKNIWFHQQCQWPYRLGKIIFYINCLCDYNSLGIASDNVHRWYNYNMPTNCMTLHIIIVIIHTGWQLHWLRRLHKNKKPHYCVGLPGESGYSK